MKKSGLIITLLFIALFGHAQDDEYVNGDESSSKKSSSGKSGFDWSRTTLGGGFYAAFGSNSYFLLAPTLGYHLSDNFLVGNVVKHTRNVNRIVGHFQKVL